MNKQINNTKYTGRQIAIFTDVHGLLEPLEAILKDMATKKIKEIYSLGDNIGLGPNPKEVLDILQKYHVISVAGNSEEYCILGTEPFHVYFDESKRKSQLWTLSKLTKKRLKMLESYPHSIELLIGGKKIALCHFANDVRIDFTTRSTWTYQSKFMFGNAHKQFLYTNSSKQLNRIQKNINKYGKDTPAINGYLSAKKDPLFSGHRVDFYDAIFQGHTHFKMYERGNSTDFYSIRAVGMAYNKNPIDTASYIILKEKTNNMGFDLEEILVKYDRKKMENAILNSDGPMNVIKKFTNMTK